MLNIFMYYTPPTILILLTCCIPSHKHVFTSKVENSVIGLDKQKKISVKLQIISYPSVLTYVLGAQKNRLIEKVILSTQHMFGLRNKKIKFPLRTLNESPVVWILIRRL